MWLQMKTEVDEGYFDYPEMLMRKCGYALLKGQHVTHSIPTCEAPTPAHILYTHTIPTWSNHTYILYLPHTGYLEKNTTHMLTCKRTRTLYVHIWEPNIGQTQRHCYMGKCFYYFCLLFYWLNGLLIDWLIRTLYCWLLLIKWYQCLEMKRVGSRASFLCTILLFYRDPVGEA